jgi:hypothetical protein
MRAVGAHEPAVERVGAHLAGEHRVPLLAPDRDVLRVQQLVRVAADELLRLGPHQPAEGRVDAQQAPAFLDHGAVERHPHRRVLEDALEALVAGPQQPLGLLARGDVLQLAEDRLGAAVVVDRHRAGHARPHDAAVRAQVALLEGLLVPAAAGQQGGARDARPDIVGMRHLQQRVADQPVGAASQQAAERRVDLDPAPVEIKQTHADEAARERPTQGFQHAHHRLHRRT